ncbi:15195_t:CDS:2, partial [Acaulospora colombiana]
PKHFENGLNIEEHCLYCFNESIHIIAFDNGPFSDMITNLSVNKSRNTQHVEAIRVWETALWREISSQSSFSTGLLRGCGITFTRVGLSLVLTCNMVMTLQASTPRIDSQVHKDDRTKANDS